MQVNTRQKHYDHQLRDVLHIIATTPDVEACVSLILQTAQQSVGASGASFRSLGEPAFAITVGEGVDTEATLKYDFADFDAPSGLFKYPVRDDQRLLGVLVLEMAVGPSEAKQDLLAALVDGLVIVLSRANAQFKVSKTKQLADALLASSSDPVLVFDAEWRLVMANPAAATVFSITTLGKTLEEIVQSEELVAFAEGQNSANELNIGEKTFVPHVEVVNDEQNEPGGWILALHDITHFKKLNRSQSEFIRIISHDIRSPLTSMQGFASMMEMVGELNEKQMQFIEKVLSGITQITALVENIQDAGRFDMETGFYEVSRSQADLREMVNRIVSNQLIPSDKQGLAISVSVNDNVPVINADTVMLERAISNLVDNAVKYTPDGGKIDVLVHTSAENLMVSVRDNGLGISPENQKKLFQRHMRLARQEHKRIKGTGLGLFIVKSVAQRHGGDAWVESAENVGSTFSFNIPLKGANLVIPDQSD